MITDTLLQVSELFIVSFQNVFLLRKEGNMFCFFKTLAMVHPKDMTINEMGVTKRALEIGSCMLS